MASKAADAKKAIDKEHGQKKPAFEEGAKKRAEKKKKAKRGQESYKIYIHKVMMQIHPEFGMSSKAMAVMDSFMDDIFAKLTQEAGRLARYNRKPTISPCEIQTAVRLVLPRELANHAIAEGIGAVTRSSSA